MASGSDTIDKQPFGHTRDGKEVFLFTLRAGDVTVRVINFGCVIKDILVPDKGGNVADVAIGHDTFDGYEDNPAFLGAICGRVANRIDGASFTLDGVKHNVSKNDPLGDHMCHGGFKGLTRRYFDWSIDATKLVLTYVDEDGAEGFPGDVTITVTYELTVEDGLMIDYKAETNKPTPIDLSNHCMYNLGGHDAGYCRDHVVNVNSSQELVFNKTFIPTGETVALEGTPCDLQKPTLLNTILDKLPGGDGLHGALILNGKRGEKKLVARVVHPASGRNVEVYSTETICIVYSCYYLDFLLKGAKGKGGVSYQKSGGLLFMPQGYPDAVNHDQFPSSILRPGETYRSTSWYKFGVET